jgi:hypothetical protein
MTASERRKGAAGEAEARAVFTDAGWVTRAMQRNLGGAQGDFHATHPVGDARLRSCARLVVQDCSTPGAVDALSHALDLAVPLTDVRLHVDAKRHEVLRLPLWMRQVEAEAPPGFVPVVAYRRSREPWYAVLPLVALAAMIAGNAEYGR